MASLTCLNFTNANLGNCSISSIIPYWDIIWPRVILSYSSGIPPTHSYLTKIRQGFAPSIFSEKEGKLLEVDCTLDDT